jgi:capsular polysaccharide transport system permease protein
MNEKLEAKKVYANALPPEQAVHDPSFHDGLFHDGLVVTMIRSEPAPILRARAKTLSERIQTEFRRYPLEILLIGLPTLFAVLYFGVFMANQYVSETQFVVRAASAKGASPFAVMSQDKGLVRADEDSFLVNEFLKSRDSINKLVKENGLLSALSVPEADFFNRWPGLINGHGREDLYEHYVNFISVKTDSASGITTLKVRAFHPEDARRISNALMKHAEKVVNLLNDRARQDTMNVAKSVVDRAEKRVIAMQDQITAFRNREKTLDPKLQAAAISDLNAKAMAERTSILTMLRETQIATPDSPRIPALQNRLNVLDQQIAQQKSLIVGADKSLVNMMSEYEKLVLQRDLSARALTAALSSLESAQQDAMRQQLYLERIVESNLPDRSQYPQRLYTIAIWLLVCIAVWWIVKSVVSVVMQHN